MYTPEQKSVIAKAEALMVATMSRYDPSHDVYHVQRVRNTALAIANALETKPNLFVVELGALLHDVLDRKYVSAELVADPYSFFLPYFEAWTKDSNFDMIADGTARQVVQIIDNVSWTTETKRLANGEWGKWQKESIELHCVQDADRLDAIGAFGVLRCSAYNASRNNALHAPKDDPAHADSAVEHFSYKLIHVHERLKTEPGRAMGQKRHKLILDFLESVNEEANCTIPT